MEIYTLYYLIEFPKEVQAKKKNKVLRLMVEFYAVPLGVPLQKQTNKPVKGAN